jgi:probable dihydroxyacetone kinase regulator
MIFYSKFKVRKKVVMSASYITEKALADSLKRLMEIHPVNKITVKMITDYCSLTRHTFYNHFKDVYELLGWIFENEVIDDLEKCCSLTGWKSGVLIVLQYTLNNKIICLNTFRSLGREHLEMFLYKTFYEVLQGVIKDITKNMEVDENIKKETADFFSYGITGQFLAWLNNGLKENPNDIADRVEKLLEGTILGIMLKNNTAGIRPAP